MNPTHKRFSVFTLLLFLFSFMPMQSAQAATLTVTNTNDSGAGSLRQAIADANSGDTIIFDASLSSDTLTLVSTLTFSNNVTIDGSALTSPLSISGISTVRVFQVNSGITVILDSLIIENGAGTTGAGIYNSGTLEVNNSTFSGNSANDMGGGIYNLGTLEVNNSTFSGNSTAYYGGGIYNLGTLTVDNSTFSGNFSIDGGGIYNRGTLEVNNNTFSGNSADLGGGIFNDGTLIVDNSTFSSNSASSSGGGIYNSSFGLLGFKNTILANSLSGLDCYNNSGSVDPGNTNNLVETQSGCGTPAITSDPLLAPLADNGGATQTMALNIGSPAIDAGDNAACESSDQRGITRPQGILCDLGAYEFDQDPILNGFVYQSPASSPTNADTLTFRVNFNEPVQHVDITDFALNSSSTAELSGFSAVSGNEYDITVSGGNLAGFNGTVGLDLAASQDITDMTGNALLSGEPGADLIYMVDNTQPAVTINQASSQSDPTGSSPVHFTAVFNEDIAFPTFDYTDVNISGTASTGSVSVNMISATTYDVEVEVLGNGRVIATIPADVAQDYAGNTNAASTSSDNLVTLSGYLTYDFGDAPDHYGTTVGSSGAVHQLGSNVYLGTCVDSELDGAPSTAANGDDDHAGYTVTGTCSTAGDEDGVAFTNDMVPGENATIDITANVPCNLSAWIDFDGNGFWAGTGEQIFSDQFLLAGVNRLNFSVPAAASLGNTFARFRCTTENGVSYSGSASDGEVEDYLVSIVVPTPEIDIQRLVGVSIVDGGTDIISPSYGTITLIYTIDNSHGTEVLNVSDITASNFTNVSNFVPGSATAFHVPAHGSETFEFSITIDTPNSFRFDLDFINDDSDEANYDITVSGITLDLLVIDGGGTAPVDGAMLSASINQLSIQFNKEVLTGGGINAADYTGNYLLVEAGLNKNFDTLSCDAGLVSDDKNIIINRADYDGITHTANLTINSGMELPNGSYRLFVCGTTSIEDLFGIELNNGTADTLIDFTISVVDSPAKILPDTGFAVGVFTNLPLQPVNKKYNSTGLVLEIPKMEVNSSIVGVPQTKDSWDVSWLYSRAGWLEGSAYPTWAGNTVLTGHVWDADNQPGVFYNLKSLSYGDQFTIHAWGQTYTYEVRQNKLITEHNIKSVMQHEKLDWITLVTCESYNPNAQTYPFRRMVRAVLVKVE